VAVVAEHQLLSETVVNRNETHSKHLMQVIVESLKTARVSLKQLDGIAVTSGPGSFTGLRIGISTAKGLARAIGIPLVGISSLHALACQAAEPGTLVCPMIDARKSEVYHAGYRKIGSTLMLQRDEGVAAPSTVLAEIDEPCLFVGDGAVLYRDLIAEKLGVKAFFASPHQQMLHASTIARMSISRFRSNDVGPLASFVPRYIRKSDAELHRKGKIIN
jgi:tRNA threonylcarbamoyladenosine biosynthesis protein TsaB